MRDIKFRGLRKTGSGYIYGNLVVDGNKHFISDCHVYKNVINVNVTNLYEVFSDSIGQYIGFKDVNGFDVYEGSTVRAWGGETDGGFFEINVTGIISFTNYGSFDLVTKEDVYYSFGYSSFDRFEVVDSLLMPQH